MRRSQFFPSRKWCLLLLLLTNCLSSKIYIFIKYILIFKCMHVRACVCVCVRVSEYKIIIKNNINTLLNNNFYYAYFGQFVAQRIHQFVRTFDALPFDLPWKRFLFKLDATKMKPLWIHWTALKFSTLLLPNSNMYIYFI